MAKPVIAKDSVKRKVPTFSPIFFYILFKNIINLTDN